MPGYIKATRPVLEILKMAGYFPDSPRINVKIAPPLSYCSLSAHLAYKLGKQ